jgi:histidinol phosphatase-like PHP family hydrolase
LRSDWRHRRYLFHVHTPYTDGRLTVGEYADFAQRAGADTIVFLEHIRREPRYDVGRFCEEVRHAGTSGGIRTVLGFEAKLLPDGTLDIRNELLSKAAVIGIAEHSFPDDPGLLQEAFLKVVERYPRRWPKVDFVWVHPGLWYVKRGLLARKDERYREMLAVALTAGILVEQSLRWDVVDAVTAASLPQESLVIGADAHTLFDLERWVARCASEPPVTRGHTRKMQDRASTSRRSSLQDW